MYKVLWQPQPDALYCALVAKIVNYEGLILLSTSSLDVSESEFFVKTAMLFDRKKLLKVLRICQVALAAGLPIPSLKLEGLSERGVAALTSALINGDLALMLTKSYMAFWMSEYNLEEIIGAIENG